MANVIATNLVTTPRPDGSGVFPSSWAAHAGFTKAMGNDPEHGPFCRGVRNQTGAVALYAMKDKRFAVTPGVTYSIAYLVRSSVSVSVEIRFGWNGSTTGAKDTVPIAANTWTRLAFTAVAPSTASDLEIDAVIRNTGAVGDTLDMTRVIAVEGDTAREYFDGSTSHDDLYAYQWTGTPYDSTSEMVPYFAPFDEPESIQYFDEPEVIVEVAWNDNYAEPFPEWTDISDRVQAFSTKLGRSTEIGEVESGVINLVVDNTDGAFTPGNVDSPFYPYVKPRRQVRLRVPSLSDGNEKTVALVNDVRNPYFRGDSVGCGFEVSPAQTINFVIAEGQEDGPGFAPAFGNGLLLTSMSITAHNGATDDDLEPFPCNYGEHVSAAGRAYAVYVGTDLAGTPEVTGRLTVSFVGRGGGIISSVESERSIAYSSAGDYSGIETFTLENAVAPAGTVGYYVAMSVSNIPENDAYAYIVGMSSYNHGSEAFAWPDVAFMSSGSLRTAGGYGYAWEGTPNNSRTVVRTLPGAVGVLGRGYIQDWPQAFSGLTPEVTVPVTDWLSGLGDNPLSLPLRFEYDMRNPADLFTFGEGDESRAFISEVNSDVFATNVYAYSPGANVYPVSDKPVPSVTGGNETLSEGGLSGASSIRTHDLDTYQSSNGKFFYLGVSVSVPIPEIVCSRDSFSFMFLWELYAKFSDLEPWGFILRDSRYPLGHGSELLFHGSQADDGAYITFRRASDDRVAMHNAGRTNEGPMLCGISWDHLNKQVRGIMAADNGFASPFAENGTQWTWDSDTSNIAVTVGDWLSTQRFDELQIFGYSDPAFINGFADQAMQYLGRWDYALTTADMQAMLDSQSGFPGQTSDERLHYVLDQAGWPNELRRIEPTTTKVARVNWEEGTDALSYLKSTSNDALGTMFVDSGGYVTFLDRHDRVTAETAWTFDHDAGTGIESGLTFSMKEDDVINVASVTNAFGVNTTIRNQASVDEYGVKSQSYELRLQDDNEAVQYAYHMVSRYGDARVRVDAVSFNPSAHAYGYLWDVALRVALGDRVTLSGLPSTAPAPSMDLFVESVAHDVTRDGNRLKWAVTLDLSPADVWDGWVLGDPVKGVLGATTKLIY